MADKNLTIRLTRSLSGRSTNSLGLKKIGDNTIQPDNAATRGKIAKISHLVAVTEA